MLPPIPFSQLDQLLRSVLPQAMPRVPPGALPRAPLRGAAARQQPRVWQTPPFPVLAGLAASVAVSVAAILGFIVAVAAVIGSVVVIVVVAADDAIRMG